MTEKSSNQPAEIFGYPIWNQTDAAKASRQRHWCPFQNAKCTKISRLVDFPFGVCSAKHGGEIYAICPHRFDENGSVEGTSKALEDVALDYFGDLNNIMIFPEVRLPSVGNIDYVILRHKPLKPEVEDFVSVEFQSNSTTDTGALVEGMRDFLAGRNLRGRSYQFGMNTYDSIKRTVTQLMNKGVVYESWNAKCYWVIQEYFYNNLVQRYGFKSEGFSCADSARFALYNLVRRKGRLKLTFKRHIYTSVDEVYQAIKNNPAMPNKDDFVKRLNARLRIRLQVNKG